jgi:hypothetical protein
MLQYRTMWFIRDIMKLHSGTQSGTVVLPKKCSLFGSFEKF